MRYLDDSNNWKIGPKSQFIFTCLNRVRTSSRAIFGHISSPLLLQAGKHQVLVTSVRQARALVRLAQCERCGRPGPPSWTADKPIGRLILRLLIASRSLRQYQSVRRRHLNRFSRVFSPTNCVDGQTIRLSERAIKLDP